MHWHHRVGIFNLKLAALLGSGAAAKAGRTDRDKAAMIAAIWSSPRCQCT